MFYRSRKYRPSKLIKRRRKAFFARAGIVMGAFILLVGSLSLFSYYDGLTIRAVAVEGNSVIGEEKIDAIVRSALEGKYLFLFSRSNIAIYPRRQIEELLLDNFKRIEKVSVKVTDPVSLKVIIKERVPYAMWCRVIEIETEEDIIEMKEDCYFLDREGFIFAKAPNFTGYIFFKYYGSTYKEDNVGRQFLTKEEFREIDLLRSSFLSNQSASSLDIGIPIALTIIDDKDLELTLSAGSRFLFSRNQNVLDMLANVDSIFSSDIFKEDPEIDYIDLRFGNKVYFKLKE